MTKFDKVYLVAQSILLLLATVSVFTLPNSDDKLLFAVLGVCALHLMVMHVLEIKKRYIPQNGYEYIKLNISKSINIAIAFAVPIMLLYSLTHIIPEHPVVKIVANVFPIFVTFIGLLLAFLTLICVVQFVLYKKYPEARETIDRIAADKYQNTRN